MPKPRIRTGSLSRIFSSPLEIVRFIYHLPKLILLIHRLLNDKRVPFWAKCIPIGALLYVLSPIDLIRDFPVPMLGYIDDVILVYFALKTFVAACPPEVVEEHVEKLSLRWGKGGEKDTAEFRTRS